ncbi:hypothetical protein AAMO2058_001086000 [Amorphochlora amoebiformis]
MTDSALALLKNPDHLKARKNTTLLSTIAKLNKGAAHDKIIWSDTVEKRNHRGTYQKRDLVVTTNHMYNFKKGSYRSIRRKIEISKLEKILLHSTSKECLFKIYEEHDYWYKIVNIVELLKILTQRYQDIMGTGLPIEPVKTDLSSHLTLKKDVKSVCSTPRKMMKQPGLAKVKRQEPQMQGWLAKCGYHIDKYLPRYFQLVDNMLLYYSARFKGSVKLVNGVIGDIKHDEKEGIYRFKCQTPGKSLVLGGQNRERCELWAEKLRKVIKENKSIYSATPKAKASHSRMWTLSRSRAASAVRSKTRKTHRRAQISRSLRASPYNSTSNISITTLEVSKSLQPDMSMSKSARSELPQFEISNQGHETISDSDSDSNSPSHPNQISSSMSNIVTHSPRSLDTPRSIASRRTPTNADEKSAPASPEKNASSKSYKHSSSKERTKSMSPKEGRTSKPPIPLPKRGRARVKGTGITLGLREGRVGRIPRSMSATRVVDNKRRATESEDDLTHSYSNAPLVPKRPMSPIKKLDGFEDRAPTRNRRSRSTEPAGRKIKQTNSSDSISRRLSTDYLRPPKHSLQGFLLKEEPRTKKMRQRLFVLHDDVLSYFEIDLKGNIPLIPQESVVSATVELPAVFSPSAGFDFVRTGFKYRFTVGKADRLYKMAADTELQLHEWLSAIEEALTGTKSVDEPSSLMTADLKEYMTQEAPTGKVALVFTDVQSSTKLWENRKMEMAEAISLHDGILRGLLKKHRGYEVRTEGDAFFVVFWSVIDAFNWCFESQLELLNAEWPEKLLDYPPAKLEEPYWAGVRVRMGVHLGQPACKRNPIHGRMEYFGPVVNEADRIADSGHGGQVICTKSVVDDLEKAEKEGKIESSLKTKWLGKYPYEGVTQVLDIYQVIHPALEGRGVTGPGKFPELRIDWTLPNAYESTNFPESRRGSKSEEKKGMPKTKGSNVKASLAKGSE